LVLDRGDREIGIGRLDFGVIGASRAWPRNQSKPASGSFRAFESDLCSVAWCCGVDRLIEVVQGMAFAKP
jgi:hypothetical protein